MIDLGLGLAAARVPRGPLDPRTVPQLLAGAIWLPGVGDTVAGGGARSVLSQATQANTLTTAGITGDVPALTTASNGAAVWDFSGSTYPALRVVSPGTALRWTESGSYAGWFRAGALTGAVRTFFSQWPEGVDPANNRVLAALTNGDNTRLNVNGSWEGGSTDDPSFVEPDARWKMNSSGGIDFSQWHFLRFTYDATLENYSREGVNYSYRFQLFIDELWDEGSGYSAPHDGPTPETEWGSPPDGPVRGTQLFPSTAAFTLGSTHALGGSWNGQVGPVYVANGRMSAEEWRRVRLFNAPA